MGPQDRPRNAARGSRRAARKSARGSAEPHADLDGSMGDSLELPGQARLSPSQAVEADRMWKAPGHRPPDLPTTVGNPGLHPPLRDSHSYAQHRRRGDREEEADEKPQIASFLYIYIEPRGSGGRLPPGHPRELGRRGMTNPPTTRSSSTRHGMTSFRPFALDAIAPSRAPGRHASGRLPIRPLAQDRRPRSGQLPPSPLAQAPPSRVPGRRSSGRLPNHPPAQDRGPVVDDQRPPASLTQSPPRELRPPRGLQPSPGARTV